MAFAFKSVGEMLRAVGNSYQPLLPHRFLTAPLRCFSDYISFSQSAVDPIFLCFLMKMLSRLKGACRDCFWDCEN